MIEKMRTAIVDMYSFALAKIRVAEQKHRADSQAVGEATVPQTHYYSTEKDQFCPLFPSKVRMSWPSERDIPQLFLLSGVDDREKISVTLIWSHIGKLKIRHLKKTQ
ncbi:hypothetical protein AC249_AIPGENE17507 [Exaiptasia diaphana]|nr:hypothetical protein AC249_AIPGENE17507 [Exaiptasia diaphana]